MSIRVDHYVHFQPSAADPRIGTILNLMESMMTTQSETKAILEEINANLNEASTELTEKIDALSTALANAGHNTSEVDELLASIRSKAKSLADVVPNTPVDPVPVDPSANP